MTQNNRRKRQADNSKPLEIILPTLGDRILIDKPLSEMIKGKTFDVGAMVLFFISRIDMFRNKDFSNDDEELEDVAKVLIDIMNRLDLNIPYNPNGPTAKNFFYVDLPIATENEHDSSEKFSTKKVFNELKKYNSFVDFVNQIYAQIPVKDRNVSVLVKALLHLTHDSDPQRIKVFRERLQHVIDEIGKGHVDIDAVIVNKPSESKKHPGDNEPLEIILPTLNNRILIDKPLLEMIKEKIFDVGAMVLFFISRMDTFRDLIFSSEEQYLEDVAKNLIDAKKKRRTKETTCFHFSCLLDRI